MHARPVVGCAIDGESGELHRARLSPDYQEIHRWLGGLDGPVAVTYEAGPTGLGLARYLASVGIECVVAAPSELARLLVIGSRPTHRTRCTWPGRCA